MLHGLPDDDARASAADHNSLGISETPRSCAAMYRLFQNFVDCLSGAPDADALREAMAEACAALNLSCFAYLSVPHHQGESQLLISNYPLAWTTHYLQKTYERCDPVIVRALRHPE